MMNDLETLLSRPALTTAARRSRELLEHAVAAGRLTRDLPPRLRRPFDVEDARQLVTRRLAARERRFLAVVERAIYGHPRSPYRVLLEWAGCEPGDVVRLVGAEGVEGALAILADRGVYVAFDEFKGRSGAVRGSRRFRFRPADFDNPLARPHLIRFTGGSGGRPTRVQYSQQYMEEWATALALVLEAHGQSRASVAFWWPVPMHLMIMFGGMLGHPLSGWFYPVHPLPLPLRLAAWHLAFVGRLGGYRFPLPTRVDLTDPERLASWLAEHLARRGEIVLYTMPSAGARIAMAATRAGLDLRGVTFLIGGEPVTDTRRSQVEAAGARVLVVYTSAELGGLSYSCAAPASTDDVHLMVDRFAAVQRPRRVLGDGPLVDSLLFTSLSAQAPKIAFNYEPGDHMRLEERDCDCLLGALGMRTHLAEVRSFEKLTGEGVTFARSSLEEILDRVLPARFGGTGLDYQLVEEASTDGAARLILRVAPTVGDVDESALETVLLEQLGRDGPSARYQASIWRMAGSVEIRREPPLATRAGKVLPFHLLNRHSLASTDSFDTSTAGLGATPPS